jgi:hypothetical protein
MTPEELLKLKLAYLEMRISELDDLNDKLNLLAEEVSKNRDSLSRVSNALADRRSGPITEVGNSRATCPPVTDAATRFSVTPQSHFSHG